MKPNATPAFLKTRSVPFKLIPLLEKELDELVQELGRNPYESRKFRMGYTHCSGFESKRYH